MKLPNLFIVGAPKSGTTALNNFLDQHPEIFMSKPKEPHFFCEDLIQKSDEFHGGARGSYYKFRSTKDYLNIFKNRKSEKIVGEASTYYLYSVISARKIKEFNPKAKIIIMLREPASFLYAIHNEYRNSTVEDIENFEEAMKAEKSRKSGFNIPKRVRDPSYLFYSLLANYPTQIKRFTSAFPENQIKIIIFDDFNKNNSEVYREVLTFLEVDASFKPDFGRVHESAAPRSKALNYIFRNTRAIGIIRSALPLSIYDRLQSGMKKLLMKSEERAPLDPELRRRLMKDLKPEVESLSTLLKRDLVKEWGYDEM